ncbi:MAG TPA: sigma-70 family RNA polymerase sigma factor [Vicinamibacterales bacterium]|nr:sigma-70 family RNA polymerase sigma factor [Vicinamibacterales bacterium]
MDTSREVDLVRRCQAGDEGAFKDLVERHKDLVFAFLAQTGLERSRAEDLAQEVFLRVHRGLPYFRGEARLATWIYRIVANVFAQETARRRLPERPLDDPADGLAGRVLGRADRQFGDLEVKDRLEKALQQLPAQQRLLVAGHYLKGISYEDLAQAFNLPLGTVKTQLYRAKRQLRHVLETSLR